MIMRELNKLGCRCLIITSDSNQLAEAPKLRAPYVAQEMDGIEICWIRTLKYSVSKSLKRIMSWLDFEWRLLRMPKSDLPRPDVIVVSSLSILTIINGFILRRRFGSRLIFEIRDIWPLTITEEGGYSKYNPFVLGLAWIERLGYKYADAIVGTMPNLKEHVKNVLGYKKEVECIPMGVDLADLSSTVEVSADYMKAYLPEGKFVVAHAGTIGITNALDIFFECAEIMQENTDIHFLIIGEGDLKNRYQDMYGNLPNLTFAPRVPKEKVSSVLSKCDLLYFSTHKSEVWRFGQSLNKVIDYMLASKPVVASYSGFPSMINESECGTYVPAGDVDALRKEIQRYGAMPKAEREKVGARGKKWIIEHRKYASLAKDYLRVMLP